MSVNVMSNKSFASFSERTSISCSSRLYTGVTDKNFSNIISETLLSMVPLYKNPSLQIQFLTSRTYLCFLITVWSNTIEFLALHSSQTPHIISKNTIWFLMFFVFIFAHHLIICVISLKFKLIKACIIGAAPDKPLVMLLQ